VRKEQRMTSTSGRSEGGFTLLEVLIALTVIAVAFTTLLEVLARAGAAYEEGRELFGRVLYLDRKLKERDHRDLKVKRRRLPDFPRIREVVYSYGDVYFVRYEAK